MLLIELARSLNPGREVFDDVDLTLPGAQLLQDVLLRRLVDEEDHSAASIERNPPDGNIRRSVSRSASSESSSPSWASFWFSLASVCSLR